MRESNLSGPKLTIIKGIYLIAAGTIPLSRRAYQLSLIVRQFTVAG
jgi:hypothetical protein